MTSLRKKLSQKISYIQNMRYAKNNDICIPKNADIKLKISGKGNKISIPDGHFKMEITIHGDNNTIQIGQRSNITAKISVGSTGFQCNNASLTIGDATSCASVSILMLENNSYITIGNDCMFSWGVEMWCTDTHAVIDAESRKLLNHGKSIEIGNHVWVGKDVHIGKNTKIADNSIVGWCSNVTRVFNEENVVIAGNPAQIVKRGINWAPETVDNYIAKYAEIERM